MGKMADFVVVVFFNTYYIFQDTLVSELCSKSLNLLIKTKNNQIEQWGI